MLSLGNMQAAVYYSRASGDWNVNTTWSLSAPNNGVCGPAVDAGVFPVAGDVVNIRSVIGNTHTVTVTANAACASITYLLSINSGTPYLGSISVNSGMTLAVSGGVTLSNSGNVTVGGSITGQGTLTCASVTVGDYPTPWGSVTHTLTVSISNMIVTGNININSYRRYNDTEYTNGIFTQTSGTLTVNGSITTENATAINNSSFILGASSPTLVLGGAAPFTPSATGTNTITLNGTGATVSYNRSGNQTVRPTTYTNLTLAGTNAKTTTGVTVNGILSMEGTATASVAPTYGTGATLRYNTATARTAGAEWITPFVASGGVIISNTGAITMNAAKVFNSLAPLTINSGGSLSVGTDNLTLANNFSNSGTLTPGTRSVTFNGSSTQTISGSSTTTFNNLIINSAGVSLSCPINVSGILTLTNGNLNTSTTNILSITNTATTSITGGSATSFINGPVKWSLPASLSLARTYIFPIGKSTAYLPFSLVNPTTGTGTVTAQVEAFNYDAGGTSNATLNSISNTEHWLLGTAGNFTNTSVSVSRPTAISPFDVVGGSTTLTGQYASLGGTAGINGVSSSNLIGTNVFFALAELKQTITTGTIAPLSYCADNNVSVPFTKTGTFTSGNVFTAQLSDASGSFASPVTIGSLSSTADGNITATIPAGTVAGTGYRIRVISSNPSITGMYNGANITINAHPAVPTATGNLSCIGQISASGAVSGDKYVWRDAATGGNIVKTSADNTDNTFTTPVLTTSTNYWVSILNAAGCENARTQVTATYHAPSTDNPDDAGTNSWIGHVYDGSNYNTYYGRYTEAEVFDQSFVGRATCFSFTSNSVPQSIYTETFSVRYRMNSTKKGLYVVDLGSDDGGRLTVDGTLLYDNWALQAYAPRPRILMNLTGTSSLIYDFYENGGDNRVVFKNLTLVLANNLTTNTTQNVLLGSAGTAISGDVYGTLPTGVSLSETTGYQWAYSTTPGGARTDMLSATGATYTPNTSLPPFNAPGTYYIYRRAILSSVNNTGFVTYVATNESNYATLVVSTITTGTIAPLTYCAGNNVSVPFAINGTFNSGNTFAAQLSNASGSFASPVTIGSLSSTTAGTISAVVPTDIVSGTGYRIRVVSSNPVVIGTDNGVDLTMNYLPAVTTVTGALTCIGSPATFSASGAVAGEKYVWYSAATDGTLLKTSADNTDNTYTTPALAATTNYWVSIMNASGCIGSRTQVTATFPAPSTDIQNDAGTNSWIGHVYDGTDHNSYYGRYIEAETFNQIFGGDNNCFTITSNAVSRNIYTETFSVRYRMNSTRKGLYVVDLGSDDGGRLTVGGILLYNNWTNQSFGIKERILMNLTGTSSLVYDYYENAGGNRVQFNNITLVLANNLTSNTSQTISIGNTGTAISGDVYGTLPAGISLGGTGSGYQWTYSTTPGGTRIDISGATDATFTPNTTVAPFNEGGTYYIYRNAALSSTNNTGFATYVATNESNAATVVVTLITTKAITTGTIAPLTYCAGNNIPVPYTITGIFTSGNVFTAQLSDASGSFDSPVNIGALTSTSVGTIQAVVPANTVDGTGYRIRVVSSVPEIIGTDNGVNLTMNYFPAVPTATGAVICIGSTAILSASGAVSGDKYVWRDAASGGNIVKTSTDHTDNTFTTPVLAATTNYWVSILSAVSRENARTQVTATYPSVSTDILNDAGSNTWIGHVYDGKEHNTYYGRYTETETFNQIFGGDNNCFTITSNSVDRSILTTTFSVRYRMNSTKRGLYVVDLGSDDGGRLTVDGTLLYNNWTDQAYSSRPRILMNLTGTSSLVYDFYENGGGNQVKFDALALVLANNLTTNTTQTILIGNTGTAIGGDTFGALPSGISLGGTGYQWAYRTRDDVSIDIPDATGSTFTPNTSVAPFNAGGTYYIYRKAMLSSTNNTGFASYIATNESNVATLTVIGPLITVSPTALSGLSYVLGNGPSGEQSFTVSGANLIENVTVTPPTNFEISTTSGIGFVSTPIILTQSGGTLTPTTVYVRLKTGLALGNYSQNVVATSVNAVSTNVALSGSVMLNFWLGSVDTDWGNPANWTANAVPSTGNDVEFATVANCGATAVSDLHLDIDRTIGSLINITTKRLVIPTGKGLTVNNTITTDGNASRIYIQASNDGSAPNGSLIFHNGALLPVYATVEMYNKASIVIPGGGTTSASNYRWQYFGIPVSQLRAQPTFDGSYVRRWNNPNSKWVLQRNDSIILPFIGYEIAQPAPKKIFFAGKLVNCNFSTTLNYNPDITNPGQYLFSNPFTAAVDIRLLTYGAGIENAVYLFNTGSSSDWTMNGSSNVDSALPGQYVVCPKVTAGNGLIPGEIVSMQGFMVKALNGGVENTFGIPYSAVVKNSTVQRINRPRNIRNNATTDKVMTTIDIKGTILADRMWLFTDTTCTRSFDNGWDGRKMLGSALAPQLYAKEVDGDYQINCVNNIHNTTLAFRAGIDTEYTLKFTHHNIKDTYSAIYLMDLIEGITTDISQSGSEYSFRYTSVSSPEERFKIIAANNTITENTSLKQNRIKIITSENNIIVHNFDTFDGLITVCDLNGKIVQNAKINGIGITTLTTNLAYGCYIVKAKTVKHEATEKIILNKVAK